MNPLKLLFSFQGRIGRGAYAGGVVFAWALVIAIVAVFAHLAPGREKPPELLVTLLPFLVWFLFWAQLALGAKRFHDLGKTGWACLLLAIPLVGTVAFIYLLFVRGEEHDNQYGPGAGAPLAGAEITHDQQEGRGNQMSKFWWIALPLAILIFVSAWKYSEGEKVGLEGAGRKEFIAGAIETCIANPQYSGIAKPILSEYCNCYANGLADRVRHNDVVKLAREYRDKTPHSEIQKSWQSINDAASAPCRDAVIKAMNSQRR